MQIKFAFPTNVQTPDDPHKFDGEYDIIFRVNDHFRFPGKDHPLNFCCAKITHDFLPGEGVTAIVHLAPVDSKSFLPKTEHEVKESVKRQRIVEDLNEKLAFGKYSSHTWKAVAYKDPSYIIWCNENLDWLTLPEEYVLGCQHLDEQLNKEPF